MKKLPFSKNDVTALIEKHGLKTPFHLFDETGMRETTREFLDAFSWAPDFKEYFAVKGNPAPKVLKVLKDEGCGADCSSLPELVIAEKVGLKGDDIMFTSNNTPIAEYKKALELGAIINLDDITHIDYILNGGLKLPEMLSLRYNPGPKRAGNAIIGDPVNAKYGFTGDQLIEGYKRLKELGVKKFGLHTMVASNELNADYIKETAAMLFDMVLEIKEKTEVEIGLVNLGGGIGVAYRPEQTAMDIRKLGADIKKLYDGKIIAKGLRLNLLAFECARVITGPHGYLIMRAIHRKDTYKNYIGVDANMSDFMRPGVYGAYHHITVLGKEDAQPAHTYDIVGSLCENCDKFATDRFLPEIEIGDLLVLHDTGAHGAAMGFQYNGKLRAAQYLWNRETGAVTLVKKPDTLEDYLSQFEF
ncbi:MAG: diaminopimelate decarboxylase [Rickettsiales bacterium]|jgi:diaminopimelate decarboxylase|nr:diaminopimelate decarboxylase [Rickettsiales bacterium]